MRETIEDKRVGKERQEKKVKNEYIVKRVKKKEKIKMKGSGKLQVLSCCCYLLSLAYYVLYYLSQQVCLGCYIHNISAVVHTGLLQMSVIVFGNFSELWTNSLFSLQMQIVLFPCLRDISNQLILIHHSESLFHQLSVSCTKLEYVTFSTFSGVN